MPKAKASKKRGAAPRSAAMASLKPRLDDWSRRAHAEPIDVAEVVRAFVVVAERLAGRSWRRTRSPSSRRSTARRGAYLIR